MLVDAEAGESLLAAPHDSDRRTSPTADCPRGPPRAGSHRHPADADSRPTRPGGSRVPRNRWPPDPATRAGSMSSGPGTAASSSGAARGRRVHSRVQPVDQVQHRLAAQMGVPHQVHLFAVDPRRLGERAGGACRSSSAAPATGRASRSGSCRRVSHRCRHVL